MTGKEVIDYINSNNMHDKDLHFQVIENGNSGTFECFHCLHRSVVWQCDYDFSDFGYDGEGIVQMLTCANCGAEIEYRISFNDEDGEVEPEGE